MKHAKRLALATAAALSLISARAHAEEAANFTSHHLVDKKPYESYAESLPANRKLEVREYLDYEYDREPCQFYQPIPQGFEREGCNLVRTQPQAVAAAAQKPLEISNVINDYEIHFAFDSANIEPAAGNTLDQVAREIERYSPREVTVSGYADKAGPEGYNVSLSERRAEAVSEALSARGIENRVIGKEAWGEARPAIDTRDGVPLRENRRVTIEFRR